MAKKTDELKDVKEELTKYMKEQIDFEVNKAVESNTKKLIRHKNIVILKRDIIILVLIGLYAFLIYNLYNTNYFDKYLKKKDDPIVTKIESTSESKKPEEKVDLIEEYSYLLDSFNISESSKYLDDYYRGKLTEELRLYIAVSNIEPEDALENGFIDEEVVKDAYEEIFKGSPTNKSFEYNDARVKYIEAKDLYIIDGEIDKTTNIQKEILNVQEKDDKVIIDTVEGLVKEGKLYNVVKNKEIKKYDKDGLKKYQKDLTILRYTFDKEDLKIMTIEVIN